jgi:DNA invertase Pin-like site-specific DNA recombinase
VITKQDKYTAGIYCRLSADDGQAGESGSIQNQKTLLTQFCKEKGFPIHDYYLDDGWSGTNYERPDFKRMLTDIDSGKINLVIVKDLSRFGREYAQMGLYIEHYFEENDVRFIAVGENIDTINGTDNILMPITNVINSLYAKDCSNKVKAAHKALAKDGKYIGGHAPFGYVKDPIDRHHLIVDPPAADVVRKIFQMFSEGIGYVRMTKILRTEHILNPQAYFNQNNPDFYQSDYWRKPFDWHATSVRVILKNPVYLGMTVFGKTKSKGVYNKKRYHADEQDWITVEGTHEPIIARDVWDTVQKMMKEKRRECKNGETQMFAGLVKCGSCGSSLNVSYDANKGKHTGFSCWVYKNYGKERCTSHAIGWKTLQTLVLDDIRLHAAITSQATKKYIYLLTVAKVEKQQRESAKCKKQLAAAEKRIGELDTVIGKVFADSALGKISEERAQTIMQTYETEQRELKAQCIVLREDIGKADAVFAGAQNFAALVQKYTDITELNAAILNELIDKIVVHEKTVDENGEKSQQVDIYYRFIGYLPLAKMFEGVKETDAFPGQQQFLQILRNKPLTA